MNHLPAKTALAPPPLNRAARRILAKIIGIGGIKGGIGKSTTALFLALVYSLLGYKVLVIDADPGSGTCRAVYRQHRKAGIPLPFEVKAHPSDDIEDRIIDEGWHEQFDVIIIDTGGDNERILKATAAIAELMLLTCSPSPADMMTLRTTAKATVETLDDEADVRLLLVGVKSERTMRSAKDELRAAGLDVLAAVVPHSLKYQDALLDMPPNGLAYTKIQHELENPTEETPDAQ